MYFCKTPKFSIATPLDIAYKLDEYRYFMLKFSKMYVEVLLSLNFLHFPSRIV